MTSGADSDARHEGASFEPVTTQAGAVGPTPAYPPEADPDKTGGLTDAEVPGEQTDPARRLTGGDQAPVEEGVSAGEATSADESELTADDLVTPGSVEPPD